MKHTKYFDFDMLNKHSKENLDVMLDYIWLAIIVIVLYIIVTKFLEWDN